jgi:hypothetical protein
VWTCQHPELSFSTLAAHHASRAFVDIMHVRLRVAAHALSIGYNVLLSDADAVFISPVPSRHACSFFLSKNCMLHQRRCA